MRRSILLLLILPVLLLSFVPSARPAFAQEPTPTPAASFTLEGFDVDAHAGADGYFKYGEWLPIWVEIGNNGSDVNAELRVVVSGANPMQFTTPVELPAGARKRLPLYVLPNNFSRQLVVELFDGETRLASRRVEVSPQATITYLVGLISPERGALSMIDDIEIPGTRRPVQLVDLALADLPEKHEGLRSFDMLVINNTDTSSLSPEQRGALESWVRQGGRLVIGGGAAAGSAVEGLDLTLLPLENISTSEVSSVDGLESFIATSLDDDPRPVRVPGPFIVATGKTEGAALLASEGETPLLQEWRLDRGWVDFSGLDLSGSPFDAWNGTTDFWNRLAGDHAAYPEYAAPDMSARQQFASGMSYPLSNLPMLDLPSVGALALLLLIYIILVGPINYLVLRRNNRLHLAWITIPAITLVFSAASFGLGYAMHGTDVFINKIAVVQLEPSGRARVDSFIGLFSPAQSAYEVQIKDGGLISPLNPYYDPWSSASSAGVLPESRRIVLVQGNPAIVRGLSVDQWSMQSFMAEGQTIDFGQIEADLLIEGNEMLGEVRNNSAYNLNDAALVFGTKFVKLGELAAGDTAEVRLDLIGENLQNSSQPISYALFEKDLSVSSGSPPRQIEVRRAIIENLLERTPPYISSKMASPQTSALSKSPVLIGWLDAAPPEVHIAGTEPAQQTTAVVILPLTYALPETGEVSLPPGLLPGSMIEAPTEGGTCGMPGTTGVYLQRGDAVFEFNLPVDMPPEQVTNFKLNLWSDAGFFTPPEMAIYDWQDASWLRLDGVNQGINLIPASEALIDSGGSVRIRLSGENLQYCYYLDLGLEAQR